MHFCFIIIDGEFLLCYLFVFVYHRAIIICPLFVSSFRKTTIHKSQPQSKLIPPYAWHRGIITKFHKIACLQVICLCVSYSLIKLQLSKIANKIPIDAACLLSYFVLQNRFIQLSFTSYFML